MGRWLIVFIVAIGSASAQCALCKANITTSNNAELAQGINQGIIYLFVIPYLLVGIVAYLWYKNYKKISQ